MYNCMKMYRYLQKPLKMNSRLISNTTKFYNIDENHVEDSTKLSGFAKSYEKQSKILGGENEQIDTFAALFRKSKFVDLGDPVDKVVIGKVFHIVGDDLYIDFGWKFHCVCTRPTTRGDEYVRGTRVRLQIKDLELSSRFLGSKTDLTLLEADCKLLGIASTPVRPTTNNKNDL